MVYIVFLGSIMWLFCPPFIYKGFSGSASEYCCPPSFLFTNSWANKHSVYCNGSQFCTGSDRTCTPSIFMNLTFCMVFSLHCYFTCTITVTCPVKSWKPKRHLFFLYSHCSYICPSWEICCHLHFLPVSYIPPPIPYWI